MSVKDNAFNFSMSSEGGYSDDPDDSGNYYNGVLIGSNFGVDADDLAAYLDPAPPTIEAMKTLTRNDAENIWSVHYWNLLCCSNLDNCVAFSLVDSGYNIGVRPAAKLLQALINTKTDGWVGKTTIGLTNTWPGPDKPTFNAYDPDEYMACGALQRALGVDLDYVFGPKSQAALQQNNHGQELLLTAKLAVSQAKYYRSLLQFNKYGSGWLNRTWLRLGNALLQV